MAEDYARAKKSRLAAIEELDAAKVIVRPRDISAKVACCKMSAE